MAPNLLLSPSVFTQAKSSGILTVGGQEGCPAPSALPIPPLQEEIRVLSKSQLQATLLKLIQVKKKKKNQITYTDTSFPIVNLLFYSKLLIRNCVFQTDSSFLDTIYDAYVSRFASDSSSQY